MKKIFLVVLTVFVFSGCAINARQEFAKGAQIYSSQILPEYKDYVQSDKQLDEQSKITRTRTADEFQEYISDGIEGGNND